MMKLNQRGAAYSIAIILIVAVIAVVAWLYLFGQSQRNRGTINNTETEGSESPSASESATEPASPKTEIKVQGQNASVLIEPSVDNVISGVVTITVTEAPNETNMAFFAMVKQGAEDLKETGPNLGIDSDGSDGWSKLLDTTQYENGLYEISGLTMIDSDSNPLGTATAQVMIQN